MSTIVVTGIITSEEVKVINEESNFCSFRLSENVGTNEAPVYVNYECTDNLTIKQRESLKKDVRIEVVGSIVRNYAYVSQNNEPRAILNVKVLGFSFRGKLNRESKETETAAE